MTLRLFVLLCSALTGLLPALHATSVVPPSFAELVSEADAIYRGRVLTVEARKVAARDGSTIIKTFVTFAIDRALKGAAQKEVVLEFLGGTVGDESLTVSGMPKFTVGASEILFVQKNGVQFCPLVAVMHGRYRVMKDAATANEFVARDNGAPLTDVAEVALPMTQLPAQLRAAAATSAASRGLTTSAFEASIASELQRPTAPVRN